MKKYLLGIMIIIIWILITSCTHVSIGVRNIKVATSQKHTAGEFVSEAEGFVGKGKAEAPDKISGEDLKNMSDTIYNILLVVGILVAVVIGVLMGIKFLIGGIEEQADIKNSLIPYIIGCVIVFGAFAIWKTVVLIVQN